MLSIDDVMRKVTIGRAALVYPGQHIVAERVYVQYRSVRGVILCVGVVVLVAASVRGESV